MASHSLSDLEIKKAINRVREDEIRRVAFRTTATDSLRDRHDPKITQLIRLGEEKGFHRVADLLRSPSIFVTDEIREAAMSGDVVKMEELLRIHELRKDLETADPSKLKEYTRSSDSEASGLLTSLTSMVSNMRGEHIDPEVEAKIRATESAIADMMADGTISPRDRELFIVTRIVGLIEHAKHKPRSRNVFFRKAAQLAQQHNIDPHSFGSVVSPKDIKRHIRA